MTYKRCVECKEKQATHWDDNLCEECFRDLIKNDW